MIKLAGLCLAGLLATACSPSIAQTWTSQVLASPLPVTVRQPESPAPAMGYTTVVVLRNLPRDSVAAADQRAVEDALLQDGVAIFSVDYGRSENAAASALADDVLKLRADLTAKNRTFVADLPVNPARIFILPAGYALRPNIEFARDGDRTLAADVMYPVKAAKPVALLVAISCDNANRMGSSSLLFCRDTLLETAMLNGFAAAMIDHPVRPPYKGIDDLPANRKTLGAAIAKLAEVGKDVGLSGRVGVMGFSRGAPMAVLLGGNRDLVQAALVHGNRFDYTALGAEDPMLKRFEKAWGPLDSSREKWINQSAMHYLSQAPAPMFLNTSDKESAEYRDGLQKLADRLKQLSAEYVYRVDADGRGHRVTTDRVRLEEIMAFFHRHLDH